ncbi:MAG: transcription elongation factor GreA [Phycisphaeraceae bacterium]|nr:transcription elongation factor GreA [Phycisphaeraceae bacterium]
MDVITPQEKQIIENRLSELLANRVVLSERIADARALGDLSENAEYHAAREQQGLEEAEIRRLQQRIAHAQVVNTDAIKGAEVVFLGSRVRLKEVDTGDEDVFCLVGEASNNMDLDYVEVTATSPMGEALMKARVGEVVSVRAPRGLKKFEVMEIL